MKARGESPDFSIDSFYRDYSRLTADPSIDRHVHETGPKPTTTSIEAFLLGTGSTLYSKLAPLIIANTDHELLLTTCFWAHSASSNTVADILRALSAKACAPEHSNGAGKIKVRICLSSLSLWQKLFHTQELDGHIYPASKWPRALNLPLPSELPGLEIQVKSVFVKPFSVMHPKYMICDRSLAIVPSCNVSWEDWFEGALVIREAVSWQLDEDSQWRRATEAGLVSNLVDLWQAFWGPGWHFGRPKTTFWRTSHGDVPSDWIHADGCTASAPNPVEAVDDAPQVASSLPRRIAFDSGASAEEVASSVTSILLPHPHHANPQFSPTFSKEFPFVSPYSPKTEQPHTPLNNFTLGLLARARASVFILTPNLTAAPVLGALTAALWRGVDVTIVTNKSLMVLEQRVTAGTTTQTQIRRLRERYSSTVTPDSGTLRVGWFTALPEDSLQATRGPLGARSWPWRRPLAPPRHDVEAAAQTAHPVRSHLKFTAVDARVALLGSANLDRASVFTSQELGVAFENPDMTRKLQDGVEDALRGRVEWEGPIGHA